MAPVVTALQAMRGVALVVAVTVVAEVGDFRRFANARLFGEGGSTCPETLRHPDPQIEGPHVQHPPYHHPTR
jgi:hypothetical protein